MEWIDKQLQERSLPRRALADAIPSLTETKLSLVIAGKRRLTADEADAIRRFFGYRLPDDPPISVFDRIEDQLAKLDEGQRRAVVLYLEALTGGGVEPRQAI